MGNYKIAWKIDDSQPRSAIAKGIKGLQDIEKQSLKTIKALELAHKSTATQVVNGYASMGAASTSYSTTAIGGTNRMTAHFASAAKTRTVSAQKEADDIRKMVAKAVVDDEKAQTTKASVRQKIIDKAVTDDHNAQIKSANSRQKLYDKTVKDAQDAEIKKLKGIEGIQDRAYMREHAQRGSQLRKQAAQELRAERHAASFALGPNGGLLKGNRIMLNTGQLDLIAKNRGIDAMNNRLIKARLAAQGLSTSFEEAIMSATGFSRVATIMGGTAAAVGGVLGGINLISQGYKQIREDAERAAQATLAMRKGLRVEGVLKGEPTATNKTLKEALSLRAQTGLGADEASDLTRQFLGATPIGVQKEHIDKKTVDEVLIQQGILQARQGGDAGTRGELAGMIPQFRKVKDAKDLLGEQEAIRFALTEGRGDDAPLTRQLLNVAGPHVREGGMVGTLPEMAALVGATSLTAGPEAAGTRVDQIIRSLEAGRNKHRKGQGALESQADYLTKTLGIQEKEGLESQLDKLMADLGKAKSEGRNIGVYLGERGFRSAEERQAIVELESNYKAVKGRFKVAREGQDGGKVMAQNTEFLASPAGRAGVGEALTDVAEVAKGLNSERLVAAKKAAAASPEVQEGDRNVFTRTIGDWARGLSEGNIPWFSDDVTGAGKNKRIEEAAVANAHGKAKQLKLNNQQEQFIQEQASQADNPRAELINLYEAFVANKGGNSAADIGPQLDRLSIALERSNALAGGGRQAPVQVNLGAAPAIPIRNP